MQAPKPGPRDSPILPLSHEGGMGKVLTWEVKGQTALPREGMQAIEKLGASWGERPQKQQKQQDWALGKAGQGQCISKAQVSGGRL